MDINSREKHNVKLSKSLSWLLRHNLNLIDQYLKSDDIEIAKTTGYVDCESILLHPRFKFYTIKQIQEVCSLNDKQRFCIRQHPNNPEKLQIRANQGHTIHTVNPDLKIIQRANEIHHEVVHGTYRKCWPEIVKSGGLNRMKRTHIHFAKGLPGDMGVISGMRQNCEVRIYIDVVKAIEAGFKFYESSNGVILCPGNENGTLPIRFFKQVDPKSLERILIRVKDEPPQNAKQSGKIEQISKAAAKNIKRRESVITKKLDGAKSTENTCDMAPRILGTSNNGTPSSRNNDLDLCLAGDAETDKKLRKLNEKLLAIQKLKKEKKEGKQLEKNQIEKIAKEKQILMQIETLQI